MNNRTLAKPKNKNSTIFSPVFGKKLSGRTFTPEPANEGRDVANSNFGHNFGKAPLESPSFKQSCPIALSGPTHCPFGGACHICPPRVLAKLKIGQPGDKYEQEADRVADEVMRMPEPLMQRKGCLSCNDMDEEEQIQAKLTAGRNTPLVQRQVEEEEEVQRKPLALTITPLIQRQTEGENEEKEEEEEVIQNKPLGSQITSVIQRQVEEEDKEEEEVIQAKQITPLIQHRKSLGEEEDEELIQAKIAGDATHEVTPAINSGVRSLQGGGRPLSASERRFFEPRFGADFSNVRVHVDVRAANIARLVNARAFTLGQDVVLGAGEYSQNALSGRQLLAHELTHVVQQNGGSLLLQKKNDSDPFSVFKEMPEISRFSAPGIIRRKYLTKGKMYKIQTSQGGNLRLRVQPTPALNLVGKENCDGKADKCPNSVGNVASGTKAVIKEIRDYGWYVVETETIEHGARTGFVNEKYLKEEPTSIPAGAYDAEKGMCIDPLKCPQTEQSAAPPAAIETPIPVEDENAPVFEAGRATLETMEEGSPVEQLGVVQTEDGTKLWPQTNRKGPELALLPLNMRVFVDRNLSGGWSSIYVDKHQQGKPLPVPQGTHGYVASHRVSTDMPDPDAWLYRITTPGQGALELAGNLYPDYNPDCKVFGWACRDYRYLVSVLVAINDAKGRKFIYKENQSDDWDKAKTMKATKTDKDYFGGQIWVPGMGLVKALEGQVKSGSITREILSTLGDIGIGIAAFVVGLLHGAVMSVADLFIGIVDLISLAGSIIKKLFESKLISDAKAFWDEISKIRMSDIVEMVGAKWNHPNTWDKWKFRGYVIGYAIVEILMLVFSGGVATAVKWAGKIGKFGKVAQYLGKLTKVKKLINAAKALKGKSVEKLRKALKGAMALSESHVWAARVLRIPLGILRRLKKVQIDNLKKLPQWAKERFARASEKFMLRLLGCSSPCLVDVHKIAEALKLAGKGGGTVLGDATDVLRVLKSLNAGLKTAKISRKLRKSNSALMKIIKEAKLTDADFKTLAKFLTPGDLESPAQAYRTFTRYLTSVVPAKTGPNIKAFNEIVKKMIAAEKGRGAALKGPMFEQWIALHIAKLSSRKFSRITFNVRKLLKKKIPPYRRQVDTWVPDKGEIWDMKHRFGKVDPKQAADYHALIGKVASDGNTVSRVNYLFPSKEAAELNRHLKTTYKFDVHYIDKATNTMKPLL